MKRQIRPGYVLIHPNRDRRVCKLTRAFVVLVLLVSVALMIAVTLGGWNKLQGQTPINFAWCAVYLVMAFFIARWSRGLLPLAAALGVLLLAIAAIAELNGTSWYDRSYSAYAGAHAIGGGSGFSAGTLGTIVLLLIPVELVLVVVAGFAFTQGWNIEQEVPREQAEERGSKPMASGPHATTA